MRALLSISAFVFAAGALAQQQVPAPCLSRDPADRPYSRERLLALVADQTPKRAEYLIRTCGVRPPFTPELASALQQAGAEESVIAAVRSIAPKAPSEAAQRTKVNPNDGLTYVWIPSGNAMIGCSPGDSECDNVEKPPHPFTVSKGFWMGETEVTQQAYGRVIGTNPSQFKGSSRPVETVNWDEASSYCGRVGMRLPTEDEWEYAARGGKAEARYGELTDIAWYSEEPGNQTHEVKQKRPNAYGLYDMLGNVWEWTASWYEEGKTRALRGGSWDVGPSRMRVSYRSGGWPVYRVGNIGFRCVGE